MHSVVGKFLLKYFPQWDIEDCTLERCMSTYLWPILYSGRLAAFKQNGGGLHDGLPILQYLAGSLGIRPFDADWG